jgi:hypothetical protein
MWRYVNEARAEGEAEYTLGKVARLAFDRLTEYSTSLRNFEALLGIQAVTLRLEMLARVLGQYFVVGTSVAGFPFLALSLALYSDGQMLSLGIIGQHRGWSHVGFQCSSCHHIAERVSVESERQGEDS